MMKKVFDGNFKGALLLTALLLLSSTAREARAQAGNNNAQGEVEQQATGEQNANLADQLKLTPEQVGKIARIREETKEERRLVNQHVREAQRALEEAIYSDSANEALIEQRSRELSTAQAEALRLRSRMDLDVRRVLTTEQLMTLRSIRERARTRQQERRLLNPNRAQNPLRAPLGRRPNGVNQPLSPDKNTGPADANTRQNVGPRAGKRKGMFPRRQRL